MSILFKLGMLAAKTVAKVVVRGVVEGAIDGGILIAEKIMHIS